MSSIKETNRLIEEKSPYLLQHAHNPVNWFPWCEEAFEKAKKENKPIFLSIGYSTCHWCHVMEKESFEDNEVAQILNKYYISIKVDREERPDIDNIYMNFCNAFTGSGGWPLTIIMTPDQYPFFAGTYFPKKDKFNIPGLVKILNHFNEYWKNNLKDILEGSKENMHNLESILKPGKYVEISEEIFNDAYNNFSNSFDMKFGGFSQAPKFPSPHNLLFLLRYYHITNKTSALHMVEKTLVSMYKGGIFDHLDYGFSRYSTDNKWLVPHFEKMLYDNALLLLAYAELYAITHKDIYKEITNDIVIYIENVMLSEEGGFYSAEDADSEGQEGKFYTWKYSELEKILDENELQVFSKIYNISVEGNFEGLNIPNLINTPLEELIINKDLLEKIFLKLKDVRNTRIRPHKDDKILTSWNGLMVAALSYAGRVTNNSHYIKLAKDCSTFLINKMYQNNRLFSRYRKGSVGIKGYLDDYAALTWGLIELYFSTLESDYLIKAVSLTDEMINLFWDKKNGGFYLTGDDSEELVLKPKEFYDSAIPSGNSIALNNLTKLYIITNNEKYLELSTKIVEVFSNNIKKYPSNHSFLLCGYMNQIKDMKKIIISGKPTTKFIEEINNRYMPFSCLVKYEEKSIPIINNLELYKNDTNQPKIFVCNKNTCSGSVSDIDSLNKLIN